METPEPERQTINRIRQQPVNLLQAFNRADSNGANKISSLLGLLSLEIPKQPSSTDHLPSVNPRFSGVSETLFSSGWASPRVIFRDHMIELYLRVLVSLNVIIGIVCNFDFSKGLALLFLSVSLLYLGIGLAGLTKDSSKHKGRWQKQLFDLSQSVCYVVYFAGAMLYFSNMIKGITFFACCLAYLSFSVGIIVYPAEKESYLSHRKLIIFEALQLLLITLKACHVSPLNWTFTLMPLGVSAFYFTILGVFMKILLMMSFVIRGLPAQDTWLIKAMFWESWDFLSTGVSYLMIIKGVAVYCDQRVVKYILKERVLILWDPSYLWLGCFLLLTASTFTLLMGHCWKESIVDYYRKVIYKDVIMKEVTQDELNKCHQTALSQISPTYFVKRTLSDQALNGHNHSDDICAFCFDKEPNILFEPCGHGGICKDCALNYLQDKDRSCPFCKQPIKEVFVIEFDSDKQFFKTKAQIIFNY